MMRKSYKWLIAALIVVVLAIIGSYLMVEHHKQAQQNQEEKTRRLILTSQKPLSKKVGAFIWLYGYRKNSKKNWVYIKSQINLAKRTDLKYVVLPIVFKSDYMKGKQYDFSEFDRAVSAAQKKHLTPIIEFSADSLKDNKQYKVQKKQIIGKYEALIKTTIKRYCDRSVVWQMWNEPNSLFWFNQSENGNEKGLAKDWNRLGRNMQKWVRIYDPESVFLGGNLAGNYTDSGDAIKVALRAGLANYPDAISNHPYLSSSEPDNGAPENLLTINSRKKLISLGNQKLYQKLRKIPLATTEFGYSMGKSHHGVWSEGDQANYLARSLFVLDMMHQPIISLYSLVDEGNGDGQWGMYRGSAPNYTAKQSGQLVMELLSNLNDYTYNSRVKQSSARDFVLKYVRKNHAVHYVCWTMDSNHSIKVDGQSVELSQTPQIVYAK